MHWSSFWSRGLMDALLRASWHIWLCENGM